MVNLGLKSIRCVVLDAQGNACAFSSRPVHTFLGANSVEQDPKEWLRLMAEVIADCSSQVALDGVQGVSVTASASCLVCVDANGEPLCHAIMVSDARSKREAVEIENAVEQLSGHRRAIGTDMMLPKILWQRRHEPDLSSRVHLYLSPADFLILHLTGRAVTDSFTASKFLFSNDTWAYPSDLFAHLGLPRRLFPDVEPVGKVVGSLRGHLGSLNHLPADCPVVLATYDALCAVLGSGVVGTGSAAVVGGTVTSVRALAPTGHSTVSAGVYRTEWIEPGLTLVGGSNNFGGGLIEWHKQAFYQGIGDEVYELMDHEASGVGAGAEGMLFLPYLLGERAPIWDPEVRATFFGIDRRHTREHFTRAVFESVAFSARHILEHVVKAGAEVEEVRFSGGLSRITTVRRILADVLGVDVLVPENFETTAFGAALVCRWALGSGSLASLVQESVSRQRWLRVCPRSGVRDLYDRVFELYRHLYQQLGDATRMRAAIMDQFGDTLDATPASRENL